MLQEAHLDHRIQLNFDEKGGEEEEDEAAEEEEATTEAQPRRTSPRTRRIADSVDAGLSARRGPSRRSAQTSDLPIISDLLKSGQEILVQIAKEPIAKKGARITSHIALPGRFLVFMPTVTHVGVSRKIASDEERHRLKRILTARARRVFGRIHCEDRGRRRFGRGIARRSALPDESVERHQAALGIVEVAGADLPRSCR